MLNDTIETRAYDIKEAHSLVRKERALGNDVRWDGWDIVFFRPSDNGMTSTNGAFKNGRWGFDNRIEVNSEGKWEIETRNIVSLRRSRNRRR